jgi:hypothetical protein
MIKLRELNYKDSYGEEFEKFHKKWKSQKKDSTLFVQFLNRDVGYDQKKGWDSPNHSDPVGVYGYPLWYVIDYPSDIWYGQKASFLRVIRNTVPRKTLQLQYLNYSDVSNLLRKVNLSDSMIFKLEKEFKGYSQYGKILFNLIQRNYTSKDKFTVRTGKEQSEIIRKMGYLAIEDRASRMSQAVINDREPVQICFVSPLSFKVEDIFRLKGKTNLHSKDRGRSITVDEPTSDFLRAIAQRIFREVFNDKIEKYQKGEMYSTEVQFKDLFFSKQGRYISLSVIDTMDRNGLKLGQKPYKRYKKSNRWGLKIFLYCEYGEFNYTMGMEDFVKELISEIEQDIGSNQKDTSWIPMTLDNYVKTKEKEYNSERDIYLRKEDEKLLSTFNDSYGSWVKLAKDLGVSIPNYSNIIDEEKLSWLNLGKYIGNICRNNMYKIEGNTLTGKVLPLNDLLPPDSLEFLQEKDNNNFISKFFLPILKKAQPWITGYSLPTTHAYFILRRMEDEKEAELS